MNMARFGVLACILVAFSGAIAANGSVIALQDSDDPLRIIEARIDFREPQQAVIHVTLENRSAQPLSTFQIFLSAARYFTRADLEASGRLAFACGKMGHVDDAAVAPQTIASGESATVAFSIDVSVNCRRGDQERFYVYVDRISATREGRYTEPAWQRKTADVTRLLEAATPR
jgi:hypothetical protein